MKQFNEFITICMVSFHSDKIIKKILKTIPLKYKVIVTDNAISKDLKNILESSFKNVEVVIPSFNLGNGGGVNFALNKINTKENISTYEESYDVINNLNSIYIVCI